MTLHQAQMYLPTSWAFGQATQPSASRLAPKCQVIGFCMVSRLLLRRFVEGDGEEADKRRHNIFKLIPSVVQASWIIKQAVGQKPVLLGQKLTTRYSRCKVAAACPSQGLLVSSLQDSIARLAETTIHADECQTEPEQVA